jgi:hypothetical protein
LRSQFMMTTLLKSLILKPGGMCIPTGLRAPYIKNVGL